MTSLSRVIWFCVRTRCKSYPWFCDQKDSGGILEASCNPCWEDCEEQIDVAALASKEPILFYDEVDSLCNTKNINS